MPKIKAMVLDEVDIKCPHLVYSSLAMKHILEFLKTIHAKTKEFMFLGKVTKRNEIEYYLEDVYLVPQTNCTATFCETDDNRYPEWLAKIPIEDRKKIRLHGHSHVNMKTDPSGTDDIQIKKLTQQVSDYYIQLIINHSLENTVNIWDKQDMLIYTNVDQYIEIKDHTFLFTNRNHIVEITNAIPKGNYVVKNGVITLGDSISINLQTMTKIVKDDNLVITQSSEKASITELSTKEEQTQCEIDMSNKIAITAANLHNWEPKVKCWSFNLED